MVALMIKEWCPVCNKKLMRNGGLVDFMRTCPLMHYRIYYYLPPENYAAMSSESKKQNIQEYFQEYFEISSRFGIAIINAITDKKMACVLRIVNNLTYSAIDKHSIVEEISLPESWMKLDYSKPYRIEKKIKSLMLFK